MGTRRTTVLIAALALIIALGACGDGDDEETAATGTKEAGITTDQGTETETTPEETGTTPEEIGGKHKKDGKQQGASGVSIGGPIGEPTPGSRKACIRNVAGGFPPGPARQAVLRQCKKLPR